MRACVCVRAYLRSPRPFLVVFMCFITTLEQEKEGLQQVIQRQEEESQAGAHACAQLVRLQLELSVMQKVPHTKY
jgi:hypothetical protein